MTENQIATLIVDASLKIHRNPGPGLLESVYEATLAYELNGLLINFNVELIKNGIHRVVNRLPE